MVAKRKYTKNLPAVKLAYYRWVKIKKHYAAPFNKTEFCKMKGVPISTLTSWDEAIKEMPKDKAEDEVNTVIDCIYQLAIEGKNPKYAELYLKSKGLLKGEKEDTPKVEFTPKDRIRIAREVLSGLRAEYQTGSGSCPICGQCKALHDEPRLDTEREHDAGSEVAAVAVSS